MSDFLRSFIAILVYLFIGHMTGIYYSFSTSPFNLGAFLLDLTLLFLIFSVVWWVTGIINSKKEEKA